MTLLLENGRLPAAWAITRGDHTATLLPNGKVLVAGGDFPTGTSAELYDQATVTWTTTGSMAAARNGGDHSATLLPNGKVLVAGGDDDTLDLDFTSAELYDPATGTWTATGNMATARSHLAATLLPNGKVLMTGGDQAFSPVTPAELYDPAAGTWTAAGIMATARRRHTATLLPNGKVLVAGGNDINDNPISSAELYDPVTGTWTSTGNMTTARFHHTASLLPNGKVLVAGGEGTGNVFASAELYDPSTGTWAATGSMNTGRFFFTASGENSSAILPNGQILIAGGGAGVCCPATVLSSAELYSTSIATSGGGSSKAFIGSSDGQMVSQDNGHSSGFGCGSIRPHDRSGPGDPGQAAGLLSIFLLSFLLRLWRTGFRINFLKRRDLMLFNKFALIGLLVIVGIITGCSTFGKPVEDLKIIEGQIDNVVLSEVANKKEFYSVTHVGFVNGQGVSLIGTYPGLSKGKTVKLKLRFYKVIRGTPYYEQLDISTGGQSEQKQPSEMKQTGAPEVSIK